MGIPCTHLRRREYPTCRHYHSYQVSNWFRASVWLVSHSTAIHVNCGLILHDYECTEMTLDETRPSMFTEDEWEYLLPQLESNGLLGVPLNVFWRETSLPPHIIGILTKNRAVYFFSNYYVRLVYKVVNDEVPPELSDLFIDDGACLKGVYMFVHMKDKVNKCHTSSAAMETITHSRSSTICSSTCQRRTEIMC